MTRGPKPCPTPLGISQVEVKHKERTAGQELGMTEIPSAILTEELCKENLGLF